MILYYKEQPVLENEELLKELLSTGAEFTKILFDKMHPIEGADLEIYKCSGKNKDNQEVNFFFLGSKSKDSCITANGHFSFSKYTIESIKKEKGLEKMDIIEVPYAELANYINPKITIKAEEILKDFYIISKTSKVEDKFGTQYTIKIVKNSDMTIGEDMLVDETMLFKDGKKIGYLKAKYTTPETIRLHNKENDRNKSFFCNKATIDYSRLQEGYKNKGLGYVLYFHTAQSLNESGIKFRRSTLNSEDANLLWKGIEKHWEEHLEFKKLKFSNESKNYCFLNIGKSMILEFLDNKPAIRKTLSV